MKTFLSRFLMLLVWIATLTGPGCRERDVADAKVDPAPARGVAVDDVPEAAVPPDRLTEVQRAVCDRVVSAGGSIEWDADGYVLGIDLASDRVQADDALVRDVLQFPHLLRLHLTISDVMPETLEGLAGLVGLEDLLLQAAPIDDAGLTSVLRSMPVLRRLTLRRLSRVTNAGLAALPACPQLEVVALIEMSGITGAAVESLRGVERMRSLDVRSCGQLTTADFAQLVSLPGLAELKVGGPAVTDQVLAILAQHPALTSLSVDDAQITPACLQQLSGSPELAGRLRALSFARCFGVTDESLTALRRFPALETLALREIMLAGSFLQFLLDDADQPLPLRTLTVTNAFFTDESLVPLPSLCPELTCLDLSGNQGVTNAALDVLRQLPSLREVKLDNTGVTQAWTPQTE